MCIPWKIFVWGLLKFLGLAPATVIVRVLPADTVIIYICRYTIFGTLSEFWPTYNNEIKFLKTC